MRIAMNSNMLSVVFSIAIQKLPGIGPKKALKFVKETHEKFPLDQFNYTDYFDIMTDEASEISVDVSYDEFQRLMSEIHNQLNSLEESGGSILFYFSDSYPKNLRYLDNPPVALFCHGNCDVLNLKLSVLEVLQ